MIDLDTIFADFSRQKVLVLGDVMIDSYLWGNAQRISPEAPVPVVLVKKREKRLGGAANVAMNVLAMGAQPILCSVIGEDKDARDFTSLMEQHKLTTEGLVYSNSRITTIKHRILAGSQHMLRVDAEQTDPIQEPDKAALWEKIQDLLPQCSVLIFEDYDKGVLDEELIQKCISLAKSLDIPTVVDPKKRNFLNYKGSSLFKPNLKELREGLKLDYDPSKLKLLPQAIQELREEMPVERVLVTLSEQGVYVDSPEGAYHIPAHIRQIADVSGAGDTVVSVAALCQALRLHPALGAALANLAGGLVCEYVGVVTVNKEQLLQEAKDAKLSLYDSA